ncbi:PREDICTED: exocyst complex component EXO70B1-like [Tarenaya hassleriana]|uniref:exocyst complex component EXO70B1-like n=1 Tax=Tarenaya hassleriana TaxID=28532 RepID=UPI00053C7D80|nr:PREDICTED: exocyst complex component EXO70B1-like [Tarenaya hassleriana]
MENNGKDQASPDERGDALQSGNSVGSAADNQEMVEEETENAIREGDDVVKEEEITVGELEVENIHFTLESLSEEFDLFLSTLQNECREGARDDYLQIPKIVGNYLDIFEEKLSRYHSGEGKMRWCEDSSEVSALMEGSDRVSKLMRSLMEIKSCLDHHGPLINHAGSIQQRAMAFLEDEFRLLLEEDNNSPQKAEQDHHQNVEAASEGDDKVTPEEVGMDYPGYPDEIVSVLRNMVDHMIRGGYGSECREVFLVARRNILMQTLKDGEFEKVSVDEVQKMSWETLEREIPIWNKTFKDCSSLFFPGEHNLSDNIFPEDNGSLFCIITHSLAIQFLGFAQAVAMTKRSTEKLFKILDIYETLRDHFPAMESLFPPEFRNELRNEANSARSRLGETAISIFSDLEHSIKSDSSKTPVPGGAVHPLTRYTMNYLKYSCEYKDTLEQVFREHSKIERSDSTNACRNNKAGDTDHDDGSPFSSQLMRIMDLLDGNLEGKSKLYRDVSLSSIFMMNNGRYIVQKIRGSPEIHGVMGDTWCRRRSSELRNYHKNYQRETWGKLLGCLGHEGLMNNGKIVKPNLKERFKSFNAMFDEIHRMQSSWVVNDEQLQSELRVSISAVIIPAYRSFLARFSQFLDPGRQTEKYIKFQPEDIEDLIDDLFDGNVSSSTVSSRRRT